MPTRCFDDADARYFRAPCDAMTMRIDASHAAVVERGARATIAAVPHTVLMLLPRGAPPTPALFCRRYARCRAMLFMRR